MAKMAFVAMFDFLGFKEARRKHGTDGLLKIYKNVMLPFIRMVMQSNIQCHIVSDSIILFSDGDTYDDFRAIITVSKKILWSGFAGHKVPLRGAIGYGDLVIDDEAIWMGSAIEDAYQGEQSQVWSGCVLTEAAEKFCIHNGYIARWTQEVAAEALITSDPDKRKYCHAYENVLLSYKIPVQVKNRTAAVKYKTRKGLAINWPIDLADGIAQDHIAPSTNAHATRIKTNTLDFEKCARAFNAAHLAKYPP